jgi:hypothetical protein
MQAISFTIERVECIFDECCNDVGAEPAGTPSAIKHFITQAFGLRSSGYPLQGLLRKTVGQAKSDELDGVHRIEMREIATRMPALLHGLRLP